MLRLWIQTRTLRDGGPHLTAPPRPARRSVASAVPAVRQRRDFLCHTAGLRRPFRSDLRGASGRKGLGWSLGCVVTLPAVAPKRRRWGSGPEGPGIQPWRPWRGGPGRGRRSPRAPGRVPGAVLCGQVPRLRPRPRSRSAFGRASYSPRPNDNKAQPFPPRI